MIEYWIQRADFSVSNRTAASASELVKVLRAHDWAREVALRRELESNNRESCPPGMGIHASGSRLLHFYFPRGETNVADVICEGATGTTHSVILEVEWEQTMTEFLAGRDLAGERVRDVDAPTETESGEEHYSAGLPIWTWLLVAIGLGLLFLSSEEMLGEFPGDIALALGCASIIPWAYYSAIDPTSSGHWRFKGWALLVGFVFVIFVVLLARFGGCTA